MIFALTGSDNDRKEKEVEHLKTVLSVSGYTKSSWKTALKPKPQSVSRDPSNSVKGSITLPYVGNATEAIASIMRKAGITVHLRPYTGFLQDQTNKIR